MLTLSVEKLLEVTGGDLLCGDADQMVNGLAIDSRHVEPGNAFVALSGERVDGHDFLGDAIAQGARVLIVNQPVDRITALLEDAAARGASVVRVADGIDSLHALAAYHRGRLFCPVIGVTGSTGKTTTKDFIVSVLSLHHRVVATEGNQNDELGLPLTLFRAGADTDVLVVEMAMRGEGQISRLARIARPTIGLVTNVGTSHIELLGSQEAVARAKGELVRAIASDGGVFLNGDDAFSGLLATETRAPVVYYGLSERCSVTAREIAIDAESLASFQIIAPDFAETVQLQVPGRHNVYNALAATAVALHLGISAQDVAEGLARARPGDVRMQSFETASGIHVINDAYNANPTSMRAAIETLADITAARRRIAVLGDMAELGSLTELAHFRIGEEVARLPIDVLVTVGSRATRIADGARAEGMVDSGIRPCASVAEAAEVLDDVAESGDVVLVKASRVMGLEAIVEGLVEPRV